jgi:hypothetical protein
MSEPLTKLPAALAKFQGEHHAAGRDGKGNYGTYTTLAGALAAVQPACSYGLSHTQTLQPIGEELMVLKTTLMHESGEQVSSELPLPIRFQGGRGNEMQAMGSALTYARRYGLLAIYGIAGDDDDGEGVSSQPQAKPAVTKTVKQTPTPAQTPKPAAKAVESAPAAPVEPPLSKEDKELILLLMTEHHEKNRKAFDQFSVEYRAHFKVGDRHKLSDHLQTEEHAEFTRQFFDAHPIKKS